MRMKKRRKYGREEKDGSNVWIIVRGKDGEPKLWQRNMELVGSLVDIGSEQYMDVSVTGAGLASTTARVYHGDGGEQRLCFQFSVTQSRTLWVDRDLFYPAGTGAGCERSGGWNAQDGLECNACGECDECECDECDCGCGYCVTTAMGTTHPNEQTGGDCVQGRMDWDSNYYDNNNDDNNDYSGIAYCYDNNGCCDMFDVWE